MLKYNLKGKSKITTSIGCEICNTKPNKKALVTSINAYHKDGTIQIHYACSKHLVDLYNKITKELEEKQTKIIL